MPLAAHIKEHPAYFHRFDALWTPSALILDPNGKERYRIEGYLPVDEWLCLKTLFSFTPGFSPVEKHTLSRNR